MKQFFETYKDKPELSTLLRENSWSNNMHIVVKTKSYEEKEFYLNSDFDYRRKAECLPSHEISIIVKNINKGQYFIGAVGRCFLW